MSVDERLRGIGQRVDRLVRRPFQVQSRWGRLAAPVLRRLGWRPRIKTGKLDALLARVAEDGPGISMVNLTPGLEKLLDAAIGELDDNVARVERAVVVLGRAPEGHGRWLWRLYQVVYRAAEWAQDPTERPALAQLLGEDAARALTPLEAGGRAATRGDRRRARDVDTLIDAALAETRSLGRQRRLLEAARQLLMETAAATRLHPEAARARRRMIARRIARLDRLEAAGVRPEVDLGYQVRQALERDDAPRLSATLTALEEAALAAGDWRLRQLASAALVQLWRGGGRAAKATQDQSLLASQQQVLGPAICAAVEKAYEGAGQQVTKLWAKHGDDYTDAFFKAAKLYYSQRPAAATLSATLAVDGCFDVGAAGTPVRAIAAGKRPRVVRYPTQQLLLGHATAVDELPQAVVDDPRALLLDLAAGRLLVRHYVTDDPLPAAGRVVKSEVRVYILDGSGSMIGPRARMRDALLLAELATVMKRLEDPEREWSPILYYRYFNDEVGETRRVATADEAFASIADVVATLRAGGTDIQKALSASFEQIREARAVDPQLGAAQIVLVTDGEAPIDEQALARAQQGVGDLPIGVSIIALGQENPALRRLAARQRARGARVFYHFMDDEELAEITDGRTAGLPIHLPGRLSGKSLSTEVRSIVGEIEQHTRGLDAAAVEQAQAMPAALDEVGVEASRLDDGARARIALLENDRTTLRRAFLRLFPAVEVGGEDDAGGGNGLDGADGVLAEVLAALASVVEVVDGFGAGALERRADAIELLERLLGEAAVAPWEYEALLRRPPPALARALRAVHQACLFD